jgi:hypothetical protein
MCSINARLNFRCCEGMTGQFLKFLSDCCGELLAKLPDGTKAQEIKN